MERRNKIKVLADYLSKTYRIKDIDKNTVYGRIVKISINGEQYYPLPREKVLNKEQGIGHKAETVRQMLEDIIGRLNTNDRVDENALLNMRHALVIDAEGKIYTRPIKIHKIIEIPTAPLSHKHKVYIENGKKYYTRVIYADLRQYMIASDDKNEINEITAHILDTGHTVLVIDKYKTALNILEVILRLYKYIRDVETAKLILSLNNKLKMLKDDIMLIANATMHKSMFTDDTTVEYHFDTGLIFRIIIKNGAVYAEIDGMRQVRIRKELIEQRIYISPHTIESIIDEYIQKIEKSETRKEKKKNKETIIPGSFIDVGNISSTRSNVYLIVVHNNKMYEVRNVVINNKKNKFVTVLRETNSENALIIRVEDRLYKLEEAINEYARKVADRNANYGLYIIFGSRKDMIDMLMHIAKEEDRENVVKAFKLISIV